MLIFVPLTLLLALIGVNSKEKTCINRNDVVNLARDVRQNNPGGNGLIIKYCNKF